MPLLADFNPKGEVSRAYGAWIEAVDHGNRSLVLIEDGEVRLVLCRTEPGRDPRRQPDLRRSRDLMEHMRVLHPAEDVYAFYDGRVDGYRFAEGPNWVDEGAIALGIASYALVGG